MVESDAPMVLAGLQLAVVPVVSVYAGVRGGVRGNFDEGAERRSLWLSPTPSTGAEEFALSGLCVIELGMAVAAEEEDEEEAEAVVPKVDNA
jgi:hypothetical protein